MLNLPPPHKLFSLLTHHSLYFVPRGIMIPQQRCSNPNNPQIKSTK
jgi:hypothetical protein